MNYHELGKSKIRVSGIALGCMSLGTDHEANHQLIHRAIEKGINFFDTADLYGKGENEITVGKALAAVRHQVVIATKVGNQLKADGSGWEWNPTKKYILEAVEKSLQRLQTDYIDLYQLHGGTIEDPIDEVIEAFEWLKQQGKIRIYGISSIRTNVIREYVKRSNIDSVMMQYSLLDRRPEESCLGLLAENKTSVLVRGSLAQGLLIDKPAAPYLGHSQEQVKSITDKVHALTNRQTSEIAIRFASSPSAVASVVVGVRNADQLETLSEVIKGQPLSEAELNTLKSVAPPLFYEQHR